MKNWSNPTNDPEIAALLAKMPIGDQVELFEDPMWELYSRKKHIEFINQKLKDIGKA